MVILGVDFFGPTPLFVNVAISKPDTITLINSPIMRYSNFDFRIEKFDFVVAP